MQLIRTGLAASLANERAIDLHALIELAEGLSRTRGALYKTSTTRARSSAFTWPAQGLRFAEEAETTERR